MSQKIIKLSPLFLAAAAAGFSTQAFSAGFSLFEQGASGQGVAYAGAAAVGEDASTVYFNPAAMTRLSGQQIVVAGHIVAPRSEYTDSGNSTAFDGTPLASTNVDGAETGVIPNFYWAAALDNGLHVGVGVNVPFGLATEYDAGWTGRYHALKSELTTINVNPAIAWKMTDTVSVGFGISYQYVDVTLSNAIDSAAFCSGNLAPQIDAASGVPGTGAATCTGAGLGVGSGGDITRDSGVKLEGDDSSFGWNVGLLFDLTVKDRLGFAYRSAIKHDIEGNATFTVDSALDAIIGTFPPPGNNLLQNSSLSTFAELPELFSISYVRDINPNWSLLADYTWTGWGSLDTIEIIFAGNPPGATSSLDLEFQNTNRVSVGAHYKPGNKWIFRGGLAYDESPVRSDEQRSARVPDNDRTWLSFGFGYEPSQSWSLDVGYSHLFVSDTGINNTSLSASNATLVGSYEASVDILSAGVNFNF